MNASDHAALAQRYVSLALDERDGSGAVKLVLEHVLAGELPLADLYERVLAPAQIEIGERWHRNEITVADEHYATELTRHSMAMAAGLTKPPEERAGLVVLAAPAGEAHDLALRMASDLLEREGVDVRLLGGATPPDALGAFVARERPDAVGLTCATLEAADGAATAVAAVRAADPRIGIVLAGRCAAEHPEVAAAAGADAVVTSLGEGVRLLAELATRQADDVPG